MALKPRYRKFVDALLAGETQEKAAIHAGYSPRSARAEASRLMTIPNIASAYEKGIAAQERAAEKRAASHGVTKEWWIKSLREIANADIDAFIQIEEFLRFTGKSGKRFTGTRAKAVATKLRKAGLGKLIKKISENKNGIAIELHSKQFAFELLGSHFGWKRENVHHSGGTADVVAIVDEAALAKALKRAEEDF